MTDKNDRQTNAKSRVAARKNEKPRLSPITGKAMEQVLLHGVVIDCCKSSGGIWLDAGELEELVKAMSAAAEQAKSKSWIAEFFKGLTGVGPKNLGEKSHNFAGQNLR